MEELARISEVQVTPAKIVFDEAAIEKKIDDLIYPYTDVDEEVIKSIKLKEARACRANLNKISKELNDARKAVKREYVKPLNEFEDKIKKLDKRIKEPCAVIDGVIKEREEQQRYERFSELADAYITFAPALAEVVPAENIIEKSWCNASTPWSKAEKLLDNKVSNIAHDLEALEELQLYKPDETKRYFLDNLSFTDAINYDNKLKQRDEEIKNMDKMRAEYRTQPKKERCVVAKTITIFGKAELVDDVAQIAREIGLRVTE